MSDEYLEGEGWDGDPATPEHISRFWYIEQDVDCDDSEFSD